MKVCVFCASSAKIDPVYFKATKILAEELVRNNIQVVYGGGRVGLMGQLADTIIEKGGDIQGIIPSFMYDLGWAHPGVPMEVVSDMHVRIGQYLLNTSGAIALPGGSGTMAELLEVITLKRLGLYDEPIVVLNTGGFYDPLIQMLNKSASEKFMEDREMNMWKFVDEPIEVVQLLKSGN